MKIYNLITEQKIPVDISAAWEFFSSPHNLALITPKEMGFIITSDYSKQQKMYAGILIGYKISPLAGIKVDWLTEITHVKDKEYFIDEQRFGPYALWHHQHHFLEIQGGILMRDVLSYAIPLGFIGRLAHKLFVKQKIRDIFEYREKKIEEIFGKWPAQATNVAGQIRTGE